MAHRDAAGIALGSEAIELGAVTVEGLNGALGGLTRGVEAGEDVMGDFGEGVAGGVDVATVAVGVQRGGFVVRWIRSSRVRRTRRFRRRR